MQAKQPQCKGNSLNSGVYAGNAEILTEILSKVYRIHEDDDQKLLTDACNLKKEWFHKHTMIDLHANFVLNVSCAFSNSMISRINTNKNNVLKAAFIHGAANCNMHALCTYFNLPIPSNNQFKKRKTSMQRFFHDYAMIILKTHKDALIFIIVFFVILKILFCRFRNYK
jgi:hypothetical protein